MLPITVRGYDCRISPLRRRTLAAFAAFALASSAIAEGATTDVASKHWMTITMCNRFRATVFVAFAFPEKGDWTSRGWLRVPSGTCKNAKLPAAEFSFRAESMWYPNGNHNSRNEWGGSQRFCVAAGRFAFHPARGGCHGGKLSKFSTTLGYDGNIRLTLEADGRGAKVTFL